MNIFLNIVLVKIIAMGKSETTLIMLMMITQIVVTDLGMA